MPIFQYKAKNDHRENVSGKVEAKDIEQAQTVLRDRGLFVVSIREGGDGELFSISFLNAVSRNEIIGFTRQLSTMITAGLSLLDALQILQRQSKPAMQKLLDEVVREIEGGSTFAKALSTHKEFSRIYYNLVKAGETAGVLSEVLSRLADNLERDKEFRGKVQGALIYPVIVLFVMAVVGLIMMVFVIPKLTAMYQDFGADLPFMTQLLISLSNVLARFWFVLVAAVVGGFFALRAWRQTSDGAHRYDRFLLKLPVFGVLRQKMILTEFARTMALLLGAGISLLEALEIVGNGIDNIIYRDAVKEAYDYVEKGTALSQAIQRYDIFPAIFSQMIAVGEETGQLDEVLTKLSKYFESETEQAVKGLTTALEPMIMVVLGLGVGFLIIAIVMPIYTLTSQF